MSLIEVGARYALVLIVVLPLLAALVVAAGGARRPELGGAVGPWTGAVTVVLALLLAGRVGTGDAVAVVAGRADGSATAGLVADRLGVVLLLLTTGVSAVVQGFARRYLRGDPRAGRFFAATGLLTAATAAAVTAVTLVGLALAWTVAGIALCLLLGLHRDSAAARTGVRRTARAFLVGDAALWAAVAVVVIGWGDLDLRQPVPADLPAGAVTVAACLVVVAALARSAQVPFHGWLPVTLAAPTPVSALLHAGVVNAGGLLLVRTGPLVGAVPPAMHLAFAAGAVTAVYGTVLMLTRPDVKGALAHSTVAQMGFMVMACGLGWYAAAVVHLVAHGLYKATLFLGSGSAVHRHVRHLRTGPLPPLAAGVRTALVAVAVTAPALVLAATAVVLPGPAAKPGTVPLLVFAWATAAWITWGWLRRRPTPAGAAVALAALAALLPAYVLLVDAGTAFLGPLPPAPDAAAPALLAPVVVAMAAVAVVRLLPAHPRVAGLHRALYVRALVDAHPAVPLRAPAAPRRRSAPPVLVPAPEGARP